MRYPGRCHCGAVEVAFEPTQAASELQLRECACSFCRRHGATSLTDPAGKLERLRGDRELQRGAIFGVAPTGRRIEYAGAALFRFRDERIWNVWVLGDVDGLKRQLAAPP
jgi:hypothetical protein